VSEPVILQFPAAPERVQLARLVVAGIADGLGFDLDEIEDLRIAVDELCFALLGAGDAVGPLQLVYRPTDDGLVVEGECRVDVGAGRVELTELSEAILSSLTDEHEVTWADSSARFRLRKRRVEAS